MAEKIDNVVVPDNHDTQATVEMYDRIPDIFSGHFAGFRSVMPDILLAHSLAQTPVCESRVIEIGCGDGRDAASAFVPLSGVYNGYDPSIGLLNIARSRLPQAPADMFKLGFAQTTDYPQDTDIMMSVNSILHVPKEDLSDMYTRVAAGLRRGGILYMITKVEDADKTEVYSDDFNGIKGERTFYHHSPATLEDLAAPAGFVTVHSERTEVDSKPWDWLTLALAKTA